MDVWLNVGAGQSEQKQTVVWTVAVFLRCVFEFSDDLALNPVTSVNWRRLQTLI